MNLRGAFRMSSKTMQMVCDRADMQTGFLTLASRRSPKNAVTSTVSLQNVFNAV